MISWICFISPFSYTFPVSFITFSYSFYFVKKELSTNPDYQYSFLKIFIPWREIRLRMIFSHFSSLTGWLSYLPLGKTCYRYITPWKHLGNKRETKRNKILKENPNIRKVWIPEFSESLYENQYFLEIQMVLMDF